MFTVAAQLADFAFIYQFANESVSSSGGLRLIYKPHTIPDSLSWAAVPNNIWAQPFLLSPWIFVPFLVEEPLTLSSWDSDVVKFLTWTSMVSRASPLFGSIIQRQDS